jgi:hypothetical protein
MQVGAWLHAPQSSGTKFRRGVNSRHFGSEREREREEEAEREQVRWRKKGKKSCLFNS